ncbi:tol-pal system-associated acyl-CoA thioesterase [Pelistega europaea]|uniref:Tol-pal system-associated acyl-CoA thioesterase n=1 Tax=Pelistega europaea TaxID=106147 RepID=A0A7Y4L8C5_9BURK|nr:tol-pal system-associated acyl-CoA thioesterase [Pelistega europaea]NOL48819.1 tol-pal system-associated acyl-CoA thioesterase [Pelistega europaea]
MNSDTPTEFTLPIRVYYEDTDAGGVVFYANYLKFFERARTEWLRRLGFHQSELAEKLRVIFVVVGTQVQYKSPARLDDLLTIKTRIAKIGNASIDFEQICERDGKLLVHSHFQICCVSLDSFKACPIPDSIRSILLSVQDI